MDPRATLTAFDRYLADQGLALEAVVVGGAESARQDLNPGLPAHVHATLEDLARRLGHGP